MKRLFTLQLRVGMLFILTLAALLGTQSAMAQEAYVERSTDYKTLTFYYDNLKSTRVGATFSLNSGATVPAWLKDEEAFRSYYVNKVIFDYSFRGARPTSTYQWFYQLRQLTHIYNLDNLNTSQVTTMAEMFSTCNQLKILDLSSFDMTRVTNTSMMFYCCSNLTTIYVNTSTWNLSAVTTSDYMFTGCNYLVGGSGTAFTSSHVDKTYARIDLGANSTSPGYLTTAPKAYVVYTPDNHTLTFYWDNNRASRPGTRYFLNKDIIGANEPLWVTDGTNASVTKVVFDSEFIHCNVTTTHQWFYQMTSLTEIQGLNNLRSSVIRDMSQMFEGCGLTDYDFTQTYFAVFNTEDMGRMFYDSKFTKIDLSNWNTTVPGTYTMSLGDVRVMFANCSNLETVVLTGPAWDMSTLSDAPGMFKDSPRLTTIVTNDNWSLSGVNTSDMFKGCTSLVGYNGTAYDPSHVHGNYARFDGGPTSSTPGYFTYLPYAELSSDHKTLTFYCDNNRPAGAYLLNHGSNRPGWYTYASSVERVVFDSSFAHAWPATTYSWFGAMENLTSIEGMHRLNTAHVNNMGRMFEMCRKLTTLDLARFNTAEVTDMLWMFGSLSALKTIYVSDGWTVANVVRHEPMFSGCTNLVGGKGTAYDVYHTNKTYARIDGGTGSPGYLTAAPYVVVSTDNKTLTFYCDNYKSSRAGTSFFIKPVTPGVAPEWHPYRSTVTTVKFDASFANARPTDMVSWFAGFAQLTSVTGLANVNTSEVTSLNRLFYGCSKLTTLDLSGFQTSKVTNMGEMFSGCSALTTVKVATGWSTAAVTASSGMFQGCTNIMGSAGTTFDSSHIDRTYARIDRGTSAPGYLSAEIEAYAYLTGGSLIFYYDGLRLTRVGTTYVVKNSSSVDPGWVTDGKNATVQHVYFDNSFTAASPTSMYKWFYGMTNLVDATGFSNLNTSAVTSMNYLFYGCSKLTTLSLSHFDTSNTMSMYNMFNGCSGLKILDLSSFDMTKVSSTASMFEGCSALERIFVGEGWNIPSGANSSGMFTGCTSLRSHLGTAFNSNRVTKDYAHVDDASQTPRGYLSPAPYAVLNSSKLTFYCDLQKSTRTGTVFNIPTTLNIAPPWFSNRYRIFEVAFDPSFKYSRQQSGYYWFYGMDILARITGLNYLNTSMMQNMNGMFFECKKLTEVDLGDFNTSQVTTMNKMFQGCTQLKTIVIGSGWDLANVTSSTDMFTGCTHLLGPNGTAYNANHVDKGWARLDTNFQPGYLTYRPYAVFYSNNYLYFYADSNPNTKSGDRFVINAGDEDAPWYTAGISSGVTHVIFDSSFRNAHPTTTKSWFRDMGRLVSIANLDRLHTEQVTDMSSMFRGCSLTTLNLSGFNTANVKNMDSMFQGSNSLTTVNISANWNTDNVTSSTNMFTGCSAIVGGNGTTYSGSHVDKEYARLDAEGTPGYFTGEPPYLILSPDETTLTLYNDGMSTVKEGTRYNFTTNYMTTPEWNSKAGGITKVVFDPSFATVRPEWVNYWFRNMTNLTIIEGMEYFNYSETSRFSGLFMNCSSLTFIDLSHFTPTNHNMSDMFKGCTNLKTILVASDWPDDPSTAAANMFEGCTSLVGGMGTTYDPANVGSHGYDKIYCRIDRGPNSTKPGYLTVNTREYYATWDAATSTVTHYYDWKKNQRIAAGEDVTDGQGYDEMPSGYGDVPLEGIEKVVYDESCAQSDGFYDAWTCGGMENLTAVEGLEYLGTSGNIYLYYMFAGCSSLTTLDLSSFDTRNVKNMGGLFKGCTNLQNLTLGENFSTESVTAMAYMFADGCNPAVIQTVIAHENFSTENVVNMQEMFANITTGTSVLDLTKFNTAKVTNMTNMFKGSTALTTILVGYDWTTEAVTSGGGMFTGCTNLVGGAGTTFSTSHVTADYAHIDGGTPRPGYLSGIVYEPYAVFDGSTNTLAFYADGKMDEKQGTVYEIPAEGQLPGWFRDNTNLLVSNVVIDPSFITAWPTSMIRWFCDMANLSQITGLENLVTSEVTDMQGLFSGSTNLTSLDLTSFDTHNVVNMSNMFNSCQNLTTILVGSGWNTDAAQTTKGMFYNCYALEGSAGTLWQQDIHGNMNIDMLSYAHVDGGTDNPGLLSGVLQAYVHKSQDNHTLTFYFDTKRYSRQGTTYDLNTSTIAPAWAGYNTSIFNAVFDPSFAEVRPTTTFRWFYYLTSLTEIQGLEYLNTSEVTTMAEMFSQSRALTSLDLRTLDTQKVTDMRAMFFSSKALKDLQLFSLNSTNRVSFNQMFAGCSSLEVLDLSSLNTANVYNMTYLFNGCSALKTIYVGDGWDASGVVNQSIFPGCTSLVGGNGTTYDPEHLDKTYAIIDGTNGQPGYLTAKPSAYAVYTDPDFTLTFYCDDKRDQRSGYTFDLNEGNAIPDWYDYRSQVQHVVFDASFDIARPTTTSSLFFKMENLLDITGIEHLNTSEVTKMGMMFAECSSLTELDLTTFNTSKVTNMAYMFNKCTALRTIYAGDGWDMSEVKGSGQMFALCTSLRGGYGTACDGNTNIGSEYAHIDEGPSNPGYFTDKSAFRIGDVNKDGSITIADVTALVNIILGKTTDYESRLADVNTDGSITIADVTALVNIILGKN